MAALNRQSSWGQAAGRHRRGSDHLARIWHAGPDRALLPRAVGGSGAVVALPGSATTGRILTAYAAGAATTSFHARAAVSALDLIEPHRRRAYA
jgi:hypothetical protein